MKNKEDKKGFDLKLEQDAGEIISKGEKFFEKHSNLIFYTILGIVVIAFGIWAYIEYVYKPRETKASEAIFIAEEQFMLGKDSTVLHTEGITDLGILAAIKEYKGTKAAKLGNLYAGIAYYDMGKYEDAIKYLEKYKSSDKMVSPSILRLIGDCYVQLDKLDKAISYFEKAAQKADNSVISPTCLIKAARVYEIQGKLDKALEQYKKIEEKYYDSSEVSDAKANIYRLEQLKRS